MSRKPETKRKITPEEQEAIDAFHKNEKRVDLLEGLFGDIDDDSEEVPPLEFVHKYLKVLDGVVLSIIDMKIPTFIRNEFHSGADDDIALPWQLNAITSDVTDPDSEHVHLHFVRFRGAEIETKECVLNDLSEEEQEQVGEIADYCRVECDYSDNGGDESDEEDDDEEYGPIIEIDGVPVYDSSEFIEETKPILDGACLRMYRRIVKLYGDKLHAGNDDVETLVPFSPTYEVFRDEMTGKNHDIYQIEGLTVLKGTDDLAIIGFSYTRRNNRRNRGEGLMYLSQCHISTSIRVLQSLELFLEGMEEE